MYKNRKHKWTGNIVGVDGGTLQQRKDDYEMCFWFIDKYLSRHRTLDIRQEMKNSKRHTLGRVYRNILEPLCYVVGKKEIKNGKH